MTVPNVPGFITHDGDKLFQELREWWATYILTMTPGDLDVLTVFTAHTHLINVMYTTPRLLLDSPIPGAGKTTCLEHFQRLAHNPVTVASLSSPAMLTRMLDVAIRTILIDESDRTLNADEDGIADLMAVINSGYKRGATRPVLVPAQGGTWAVKEMPTFAPVVMAGNSPNLPEDTRSRSIRVVLLPDLEESVDESNWEEIELGAYALQQHLVDWAAQVSDDVKASRPDLPLGITGRFREKWGPLKRVAVAAGGDWPAAVDELARQDREEYDMDKEDGLIKQKPQVLLIKHIYEVWGLRETPHS